MEALVVETCRRNQIVDGYIRLLVTRGAGDLGLDPRGCPRPDLVVIARAGVTLYKRKPTEGITAVTSAFRRNAADATSPAIKSLNYLNNVLARIEANDRGADEAILLDRDGHVAEATADNVFIVTERALVTPPTSTNLRGITRETILRLAEELGIRAEEKPFALFDLWSAREAFMCGTMAEVVPIASVDGRTIGTGTPGPTTLRLMAAYGELVRSTGTPIHQAAIAGGCRGSELSGVAGKTGSTMGTARLKGLLRSMVQPPLLGARRLSAPLSRASLARRRVPGAESP